MVQTGNHLPVEDGRRDFGGGFPFGDSPQGPVVEIVFRHQPSGPAIGEDHEISRRIGNHPLRNPAPDNFRTWKVRTGDGRPRILPGEIPRQAQDFRSVGPFPAVEQDDRFPEVVDEDPVEVPEERTLPQDPHNSSAFVESLFRQGQKRLARPMSHRPQRLRAAENQVTDMGIGGDIGDHTFDSEVFRQECSDNGKAWVPEDRQPLHESEVGEGADRHWRPIPKDPELSGIGRPPSLLLRSLRGTSPGQLRNTGLRKIVEGLGGRTDGTTKTIVSAWKERGLPLFEKALQGVVPVLSLPDAGE